jgi:hypothetical protein
VEAAAEARPELVRRLGYEEVGAVVAAEGVGAEAEVGVGVEDTGDVGAGSPRSPRESAAEAAPARSAPPARTSVVVPPARTSVAAVRISVTDLAEWARCPRRHHLSRRLGLAEPATGGTGASDDDPARATARGTLAHAMLAEVDAAAPPLELRAGLAAAASRRGYDPAGPGVRRILEEVARFADSPGGRALAEAARAGRLRREVPFLLRLDAGEGLPACYLDGAIDALVAPARRGGPVQVIDYKYALARRGSAERYRLQLAAYALAAARAFPGARVEARLVFLRGGFPALDVTPGPEALRRLAAEAPLMAAAAARGEGDRPPAVLGRSEARCRAEGCGFAARCFPRAREESSPGDGPAPGSARPA